MRRARRWFGWMVIAGALASACGSDDEKGACVPRANPSACGDDFTSGQCDLMNGTFHPGKKCSQL